MSRANSKAIVMIGVLTSCFEMLHKRVTVENEDLKKVIELGRRGCAETLMHWQADTSDDDKKNLNKIQTWATLVGKRKENLTPGVLVFVLERVWEELVGPIKNKKKLVILGENIGQYVDKLVLSGEILYNVPEIREGNILLNFMHKLIEWKKKEHITPLLKQGSSRG